MKRARKLILAFLVIVMAASAEDEPITDYELAMLITDYSTLSYNDQSSIEDYVHAIRMWLTIDQLKLSEEKGFAETKKLIAGKTAEDVAQMGELADRLDKNQRLIASLEVDLSTARILFDASKYRKLTDGEHHDISQSERLIQLLLNKRQSSELRKLEFRNKK